MSSRIRYWAAWVVGIAAMACAPLVLSDFRLQLLAKFLCLAMVAVGIGLAWGQGGMLTMGQGVFFGLGGYIMAMHMKLADAGPGGVPDFMMLYGTGSVPWWWEPMRNPVIALALVVLVPGLCALLLGIGVFGRRVRGAYFAILSQTLVAAFAVLLVGQQMTTGGTNGLNGFVSFFGGVVASIGFLVGVAIGGRTTLLGPVLGSIAVSLAQTSLSERFPSAWTYAQAGLFIVVVAVLPTGLAGLGGLLRHRRRAARQASETEAVPA